MIDLGPHALFIELAWGAAVLIVASLVGWVALDHRAQRRELAKLEAAAPGRRQAGGAGDRGSWRAMSSDDTAKPEASSRRLWLTLLPLGLFVAMALLFWVGLFSGDKSKIPSALIGKPVPAFALEALPGTGLPGFSSEALKDQVTLVNVWASWCIPCREEHPQLVELAKDARFKLYGLNYKDKDANAKGFLDRFGNPYVAIGIDPTGRTGIDWGVYGVPETFVIGRDGTIRYKFIGPIMPDTLQSQLMPEIEKALAK